MANKFKCKYCIDSEAVQINDKEVACCECGLVYLVHKSLKTDKVKFIPLEWY